MNRRSLWGTWIAVWMLAALWGAVLPALPSRQNGPSPVPLMLAPDDTPTPTLESPPAGGGRVSVGVLNVRAGPSTAWVRIAVLLYGEVVYPVGRDVSGAWTVIAFNNREGWVWTDAVSWDPALNLAALPVMEPPFTATLMIPTATPETPAATLPPTSEPAVVQPEPTETLTPSPMPSPSATPEPTCTATATPAVAVVLPSPLPTEQPAVTALPTTSPSPPSGSAVFISPAFWAGTGGLAVLLAIYGWRFSRGQRERRRYAGGFPLDVCPTCQVGHLLLEEYTHRTLGIPVTRRAVQCDTCRSVLRQVRPGLWRYTIDPFFNRRLAQDYNGQTFTDEGLLQLADTARAYVPERAPEAPPSMSPEFQRVVEHLDELEAQVLASEENPEATSETTAEAPESDADEAFPEEDAQE